MKFSIHKILTSACLLAGALSATRVASGQVLNLSTDLVAKGIAASNMTPNNPSLDSRPLFQAGVAYASANNIPTVVAERGSYYFLSLNSQYQHVYLNAISNVTVDLRNSDLYFALGNIMAIDVNNSVNLTLKNFTVDYLPWQSPLTPLQAQLPFTQLTVTSVNTSATPPTVSFVQDGSYPLPSTFNSLTVPASYVNDGYFVYVFRNGQQLSGTGRMSVAKGVLNDSYIQLAGTEPWTTATQLNTIQPGDTLVLEWRAGIGAIFASNSTGLTVQNVSVYASGFIGVFLGGSATTVDHVQVIPRPGTDRLISSNADGIHLGRAGENNVVTNNTVKRTCDDAIAMDGQWAAIVAAPSSTATVRVTLDNSGKVVVGDAYDFINIVNATIAGTATVLAESAPDINGVITLTLDHAISGLQQNFGVTPDDPNLRGSGTVISGNLSQEIVFGRGIYPAGVANVSVHDNMTEATNRSGIVVEQDEGLIYNYKTGPSSDIKIENNIIDNALGYGVPSSNLLLDAAGINVVAYDEHFAWVTTQSLTDISIDNNFVTNTIRTGVRMENVNVGDVSGNLVQNYGTAPDSALWFLPFCPVCETLAQVEADFAQPVIVTNSTSVTDSGNITGGTPVKNLSWADGSFRFAPTSVVVALGQHFTNRTASASGPTLPRKLAGVEVDVKDSAGVSRLAGLYYAGPSEVIYVVPEGTAPGVATVTVATQPSGALISSVAPALFSANATGSGVALATAERFTKSGKQISERVYKCSTSCAALPLNLGRPSDTLLVYFQGTGIRGRSSLKNVVAEVGGVVSPVEAAAKLPNSDPGMDYVTVKIPHSLAGAGEVPVVLTIDGFTANVVTINIK
jgi:uncharacterized protein (TIGR03437 family)